MNPQSGTGANQLVSSLTGSWVNKRFLQPSAPTLASEMGESREKRTRRQERGSIPQRAYESEDGDAGEGEPEGGEGDSDHHQVEDAPRVLPRVSLSLFLAP
jgi:hypothetical protein